MRSLSVPVVSFQTRLECKRGLTYQKKWKVTKASSLAIMDGSLSSDSTPLYYKCYCRYSAENNIHFLCFCTLNAFFVMSCLLFVLLVFCFVIL